MNNSAFLWGESIFTTILMEDCGFFFLEDHFERLEKGLKWQWGDQKNLLKEKNAIKKSLKSLQSKGRKKVRITFFRDQIDAKDEIIHWILSEEILSTNPSLSESLKLECHKHPNFSSFRPSFAKVGSYSEVLRIKREAKLRGIDDILLLDVNEEKKIEYLLETSFGNIIFFQGMDAYSPVEQNGVFSGITQKFFLEFLKLREITIYREKLDKKSLSHYDSAVVCSSISGITSVQEIDGKKFSDWNMPDRLLLNEWNQYRLKFKVRL